MRDYLFRGSLADLDPDVYQLNQLEAERQVRKLILIPSESQAPLAVREALSSSFQNIYAEGYPDEETRWMTEAEILNYVERLADYRRYSDPRYYKGVEYADIVEALARRRCAEAFAANGITADELFVNVQALSGAPANNAVYHALANPGDTIMGMNLLHGGHLSHGSPVNRSGKFFKAIHYTVDPVSEKIDYAQIEQLAQQHKPKFIIAGYSSYPWTIDWSRFKEIAKSVGAYLFADIAHVAGLVVGGVYPSPVGYADVITFTTHKSLCGPRGACILTTDETLSNKLDRAVFPGEQGGPHVNVFLAMAIAFKLARTQQFRSLQEQIVKNCVAFTDRLASRGFRIPFGGTNSHLMNLDCRSVIGKDGTTLSGDQAARILDLAGIVVNRNTIPGDKSAFDPSGIRMGTPWVTQRGFKEKEMQYLADIITDILQSITPYSVEVRRGKSRQARVEFNALENAKIQVRDLAMNAGMDFQPGEGNYPHFYYLDNHKNGKTIGYLIGGDRAREYLNFALSCDVEGLMPGESCNTQIFTPNGAVDSILTAVNSDQYRITVTAGKANLVATWLRDLSDGFVGFDDDPLKILPGPVWVVESIPEDKPDFVALNAMEKPYFIGKTTTEAMPLPNFKYSTGERPLKQTPIYETHKHLGAKLVSCAGWEMPIWYSSVLEEHLTVRQAAGIFDLTHMGVFQAEGPDAASFLDSVTGNDIGGLGINESCYTHFLDPDASVIDDLSVYRRDKNKYLIVVNARNDDKDWSWLNSVREGNVLVDREFPSARAFGRNVHLRNLRDPGEGSEMRVVIALQGPHALDILLGFEMDSISRKKLLSLLRTQLCEINLGGLKLVVARTGYTGEKIGFEIFVHPDNANDLFLRLMDLGKSRGLKPIGLAARDSLRTEAGLPAYGNEMGDGSGRGEQKDLGVGEAGFGSFIKLYKPWFIGRDAYIEREKVRKGMIVRFRFIEKGIPMAHKFDPVLDKRGNVIGWVTSCAIDSSRMLIGQAYVNKDYSNEETQIFIYHGISKEIGKSPTELELGERAVLPLPATVLSRFLK